MVMVTRGSKGVVVVGMGTSKWVVMVCVGTSFGMEVLSVGTINGMVAIVCMATRCGHKMVILASSMKTEPKRK